ncbi:hypothetical protein IKG68_02820 [Candidatus Saccharibacteria bacterium]|nr:hypothetical protein [Candidatus Saccharibacteria bacterium]
MKTLFKKIFLTLSIVFVASAAIDFTNPTPVQAECRSLFGMTSWDCGLADPWTQANLTSNIVLIASNILTDLTVIATYLTIGFVIYGGYMYIFSAGDTTKVAAGKKTLTRAFIGLAIVLLSNVILNTIRIAFLGSSGSFARDCVNTACVDEVSFVTNAINWFIGTAGAVALVFVFIGGIGYLTSSGDAAKLQKAKNTIIYALIGLAIAGLSLTITAFASNLIRQADDVAIYNNTIIAKE